MPYAEATPRPDISIPSDHETKWLVIVRGEDRMVGSVQAKGWFAAREKAQVMFGLDREEFRLEEAKAST